MRVMRVMWLIEHATWHQLLCVLIRQLADTPKSTTAPDAKLF